MLVKLSVCQVTIVGNCWLLFRSIASLRNRTAGRRGRPIACARRTWQVYYLRVFSRSSLTSMFSGLLRKDLFKGKWSLAKLFQTKLLSCLSHEVCLLLSSPVLLRKFTIQSLIPSPDVMQLILTLKTTTAQVVETSVSVNNRRIQDYTHPDDHIPHTLAWDQAPHGLMKEKNIGMRQKKNRRAKRSER